MSGSSFSVLEEGVLILCDCLQKWTSLLRVRPQCSRRPREDGFPFLPSAKERDTETNVIVDPKCSDSSHAPVSQGTCQYLAIGSGHRWTQVNTVVEQKKSYYRSPSPFSLLCATMTCMHNTRRGAQGWDLKEEPGDSSTCWSTQFGNLHLSRALISKINFIAGCEF